MILVTHGVIGASIVRIFNLNPFWAFAAGFISHFIFDAVPHWQYQLKSLKKKENDILKSNIEINYNFLLDLIRVGADGCLGLIVPFLFLDKADLTVSILSGATGGVFPDFLQFLWFKWRFKILLHLQKFHIWINPKKHLQHAGWGLSIQIVLIVLLIFASSLL